MNEQFTAVVKQLLEAKFEQELEVVYFGGKPGKIENVPFHGYLKSQKRFWGKFKLADQFALVEWIEIYFDGQFHHFSYEPELEEPFVGK